MRRKLIRAGVTTIALTTVASSAVAGSPAAMAAPQSPTAADPDPAVAGEADLGARDLAARRGIPLAEAQQRMSWQQMAPRLAREVSTKLGARFGGIWIDAKSDRLKVGVVGDGAAAVRSAASGVGLAAATDPVPVTFALSDLQGHNKWLGEQIAAVNTKDASVMLSAGIRTDLNTVVLHVPAGGLTAAQQALVDTAKRRIGTALKIDITQDKKRVAPMSCSANDCDPPLRGGVEITNSGWMCTSGFTGQDANGAFYLFTAGHCVSEPETADDWTAWFPNGSSHVVGPSANSAYGLNGDAAVLKVTNPGGWKLPSATVLVTDGPNIQRNENYKVTSDGGFLVGQTICVTGARTQKSNCGSIKEVDQTVTYTTGVTIKGLAHGTACTNPGDSGGPVFTSNTALGLIVAGYEGRCDSFYQPIQTAENLFGVSVLHA
jgi:hypothetical protein